MSDRPRNTGVCEWAICPPVELALTDTSFSPEPFKDEAAANSDIFVKSIAYTPVTLQYKDWAGTNQTLTGIVTNLAGSSETLGFTNGLRTT